MSNTSAVRFFKVRDSATSMLRKMGVAAKDYNSFIDVMPDGYFACQMAKAEAYLVSNRKVVAEIGNELSGVEPTPTKIEVGVLAEEPNPKRGGIASTCRDLILAGKTNKEIWAIIQPMFDMADNKSHYPSWYRSQLKRKSGN